MSRIYNFIAISIYAEEKNDQLKTLYEQLLLHFCLTVFSYNVFLNCLRKWVLKLKYLYGKKVKKLIRWKIVVLGSTLDQIVACENRLM